MPGSRRSRARSAPLPGFRSGRIRGRRPRAAGRCRRASSRSAAPSTRGRWRSGGSRRPAGRRCRRAPCASSVAASIIAAGPACAESGSAMASRRKRFAGDGNFGAPPKPPQVGVELLAQRAQGERRRRRAGKLAGRRLDLRQMPPDRLAQLRAPAARHRRGAPSRRGSSSAGRSGSRACRGCRSAGSRCRRRTACRSGVRKTEFGQPPWPVQHLGREHVDLVEVGPLFAVDLDVDEVLVHERAAIAGIRERLALHHVAPVAGRVADREEDRLVLGLARWPAPPAPQGYQSTGLWAWSSR